MLIGNFIEKKIVSMKLFKFIRHFLIRTWEIIRYRQDGFSQTSCDVVLICHEKDFKTVKHVIDGLSANSLNPIKNIFFVSTVKIRPNWLPKTIKYIYENDISGVKEAKILLKTLPYKGWILQQILKLSADQFSKKFIVLDCDTVLLKPHLFFDSEATVLRLAYEYSPHYRLFEKSLGISSIGFFSYTCHMMPYQSEVLSLLKIRIDNLTGMNWIEYFCKFAIDHGMAINEQDLYAKFLITEKFPVIYRPWFNKTVPIQPGISYQTLKRSFPRRNSVSLHNNKDRQLVIK